MPRIMVELKVTVELKCASPWHLAQFAQIRTSQTKLAIQYAQRLRAYISGKSQVPIYVTTNIRNTFTPQIKGSFCDI